MSTNSDLASWGESPATPAEEALGMWLDNVLTKIERGKVVEPEFLHRDAPELLERGQHLVLTAALIYECAASVWENSIMQPKNGPGGFPESSTIGLSTITARTHGVTRVYPAAIGRLPDPFPGKLRILRVLGEGAFGKVLLADDLDLGRQVALKTLKIPATSTLGPHVLAALRNDAQHLAQLDHPNIVRVHAWLEAEGEYYLVLQYIAGGSLANRLKKESALDWRDAARYVADVGEGLLAAHKRGVIHRDVKDDNILWDDERDEALLTDFGVSARLAEPGTAAGTPMFMAPEAFDGDVSPALDVYSLAVTLYRLVTGELPFPMVPNLHDLKLAGLADTDPQCHCMPELLERIIRAGLAGRPELRPTMVDFVATLRGSLNQLLADAMIPTIDEAAQAAPVNLQLVVSRLVSRECYKPIAATQPTVASLSRDMKKVPRPPEQVSLRTGDRVRVEVVCDRPGYVTIFNVGPTGNLNLLYPDEDVGTQTAPVEANKPLHILDVEMQPPTGPERLFAVWSRTPLRANPQELLSLAERGEIPCSKAYRATRDMKRVKQTIMQLPRQDWQAVVLELDHH